MKASCEQTSSFMSVSAITEKVRAVEEAARQADDVARHQDVDDLPLAVAQHLVARGHAVLDEAELAVGIAVDHEVAPLLDRALHTR